MISSVFISAAGVPAAADSVPAQAPAARIDAFENALARQTGEQPADAGAVQGVAPTAGAPDVDAQDRARRGLGLEGVAPTKAAGNGGDMILDGIQKLRGVFDVREANIADLMSRKSLDAGTMMAMQMEVTNFTLLVDISSKLTGKSTQAFDTLMKGQ